MGMKHSNHDVVMIFMACAVLALLPDTAYAGAMDESICTVTSLLQGPMGTGMATLGICAVSGAAALGKASWGMALTVVAGIAILFGAGAISTSLGIVNPCGNVT